MKPFGASRPKPFFTTKARIIHQARVGKAKAHLKFVLDDGTAIKNALAYFSDRDFSESEYLSCNFSLMKNEFNRRVDIDLKIETFIDKP